MNPLTIIILISSIVLICLLVFFIAYFYDKLHLNIATLIVNFEDKSEHFRKEITKFSPYLNDKIAIPPFEKIDKQFSTLYQTFDNSINCVTNILNNLSYLKQTEFNLLCLFPNISLTYIYKIRNAKRQVAKGEQEVNKWNQFYRDLVKLTKQYSDFKKQAREQIIQTDKLIKDVESYLSRLQSEGNKGLEKLRIKIESYFNYPDKLNQFFIRIPDSNIAQKAKLLEYRYMIKRLFFELQEVTVDFEKIHDYLLNLDHAQKWCKQNLDRIKEDNKKIQIKLGLLDQEGLNVMEFISKVDKICHTINEINIIYLKRTPTAYVNLCGSLENPGKENFIFKNITAEQDKFYKHIIKIETTFGKAKNRIKVLQNNLQQETQQIRQLEGKNCRFDQSRNKLQETELLLSQAQGLLQFSDLDKLQNIYEIVNEGLEFIEQSKTLRNLFNEQITFLVNLEKVFDNDIKPTLIKFFEILKELAKFNFEFLKIMLREPEEWENLVQNYSQQLLVDHRINVQSVVQSDVHERYTKAMMAKEEIYKLIKEVEALEPIYHEYKKFDNNIKQLDQQIRDHWKYIRKLSKNGPLYSWRKEFEMVSKLKDEWNYKWPSNNGKLLESLNNIAEKLYQKTSELIKRYEEERENLEKQIKRSFSKLSETWEWLDKKVDSSPRPSVVLYELKDRSSNYKEKFDSIERFPENLQRFSEQLSIHLEAVLEKKRIIINEEKDYNIKLKQTIKLKEDAWHLYHTTERYISKKIIPSGWPIINENDKQNFYSIHSDLQDRSSFINHLISPENLQPINSTINYLYEVQKAFQNIISQIKQNQMNLTKRYSRITAQEKTVIFLLNLYNNKLQNPQLNSEIENQINKAKKSVDFEQSELLLESAVRQIENNIPNSKEPIRNIYTNIYNEEANQGIQFGQDFTQQFGTQFSYPPTPNLGERVNQSWRKNLEDDIQKLLENINVKNW